MNSNYDEHGKASYGTSRDHSFSMPITVITARAEGRGRLKFGRLSVSELLLDGEQLGFELVVLVCELALVPGLVFRQQIR